MPYALYPLQSWLSASCPHSARNEPLSVPQNCRASLPEGLLCPLFPSAWNSSSTWRTPTLHVCLRLGGPRLLSVSGEVFPVRGPGTCTDHPQHTPILMALFCWYYLSPLLTVNAVWAQCWCWAHGACSGSAGAVNASLHQSSVLMLLTTQTF